MKRYRRRFILFNMLFVSFILVVIFASLSFVTYRTQYNELERTMRQVVMPLGSRIDDGKPDEKPDRRPDTDETPPALPDDLFETEDDDRPQRDRQAFSALDPDRTNLVTALYDTETDTVTVLSGGEEMDAELIETAVRQVAQTDESFGKLTDAGLFYYREGKDAVLRVALASTRYLSARVFGTIGMLALLLVAALALFFALSVVLSRRAAKPMEDALKMERQFVADVSHDLKTPLTVILANNAILAQHPETTVQSQMQWVESSDEAAKNMRGMIDRMLTLASLEEGKQRPVLTKTDLSAAAEKSVLQLESVAYERGITLNSEIPDGVFVSATSEYAARICTSLLENALKYEPDGGCVTLSLTQNKKHPLLTVHNAGSVIDSQDLLHVFERFYRGDKTRGETKGYGLGLPILKKITELIGAEIDAESSPETGTTFTVRFAAAK